MNIDHELRKVEAERDQLKSQLATATEALRQSGVELEELREAGKFVAQLKDDCEKSQSEIHTLTWKLNDATAQIDILKSQLRQSEAGAAVMREVLCQCKETLVKSSNMHDMVKCSNFIDQFVLAFPIDKSLSTDAGKSLLSELDQCKARLKEAEWLIGEASKCHLTKPQDNGWFPGMLSQWTSRRDKWLSEGKGGEK